MMTLQLMMIILSRCIPIGFEGAAMTTLDGNNENIEIFRS